MMLGNLTGMHLLIILGIVVLLFGATKLPALAKGLGQSINIFKKEMDIDDKKTKNADGTVQNATADPTVPQTPVVSQAPVVNPGPSAQPSATTDHRI
ncbi:twin-arginine translocase TatA/TatE family subunit [Curtobacterium sp. VKM Ac-2865]|uniref:twin-arginine translocase TatA/TatE family subunit n=1 Tax=Curtobacterium sp. VKM Ac-2865 TaxID=2783817 RepID=UPI003A5BE679